MRNPIIQSSPPVGSTRYRTIAGSLLSLLLGLGAVACDAGSTGPVPAPDDDAVMLAISSGRRTAAITPEEDTLNAIGAKLQLQVRVWNRRGRLASSPTVDWKSLNPTVASVNGSGRVTAVAEGRARIVATSRKAADTAVVVVRQIAAKVSISPASTSLGINATRELVATASDSNGVRITSATFAWSSSDPAVARVSGSGVVTAVAAGAATITAKDAKRQGADVASGASSVTVTGGAAPPPPPPLPPARQYSATTPHYPHIRLEVTDFRIGSINPSSLRAPEYDWTAAHYDFIMDGVGAEYLRRNPAIGWAPYTMYLGMDARDAGAGPNGNRFYADMQAWYSRNPQCDLETAFLHRAEPRNSANRMEVAAWEGAANWRLNMGDPCYRDYSVDRFQRIAATGATAIFVDSHDFSSTGVPLSYGSVEYRSNDDLHRAITGYLQYVRPRALGSRPFHLNVAEYSDSWIDQWLQAAGSAHLEFYHDARRTVDWQKVDRWVGMGITVQLIGSTTKGEYDRYASWSAGNERSRGARGKLWELASYYMVRPPANDIDRVRMTNLNTWDATFESAWTKAIEVDVGHPREPRRVYFSGTLTGVKDASGRDLQWQIHGREYDNALILNRAPMGWEQKYVCGDDTVVRVTLPTTNSWFMLYEDGTVASTAITSLQLRNCEAAILMKSSR